MARHMAEEISRKLGMISSPDEFWEEVLDAGAGVINHREKLADDGDVLVVRGTRFEFTSVEDERGEGVFVHRFERIDGDSQ